MFSVCKNFQFRFYLVESYFEHQFETPLMRVLLRHIEVVDFMSAERILRSKSQLELELQKITHLAG